jgi:hypothetical protein
MYFNHVDCEGEASSIEYFSIDVLTFFYDGRMELPKHVEN